MSGLKWRHVHDKALNFTPLTVYNEKLHVLLIEEKVSYPVSQILFNGCLDHDTPLVNK